MGGGPKKPKPTREETLMQQRQVEQLARLDEEENTRLKRLGRLRLGGRGLLGGATRSRSTAASGGGGAAGGGGFAGGGGTRGGGGRSRAQAV